MADTTANLGLGVNPGLPDGSGGNPFLTGANNPYLQANIDAASADLVKNYNLAQVPAQNAAAVRSGSFGNSALGEMAQQDQNILQKNLGNLSNSARMQDYTNQQNLYMQQQGMNTAANQWNLGFGRDLYNDAYGQNMQNLQTGIGLLGTLNGYNQGDLSTATGVQNAPLNYWSAFSNAANGLGQGFGTSTNVQGTSSNPALTAAGGAQLGQNLWSKWSGNNSTPSSGSGSSWWSGTDSSIGGDNSTGNWMQFGTGAD